MLVLPNPKLIIRVDKREKRPLIFPAVMPWSFGKKISRTFELEIDMSENLDAGDYMLKGYEDLCRVERKGSVAELMQNLFTSDRARFERSLKRMIDSCKHPVLLLDFSHREFLSSPYVKNPREVRNEVFRLCAWKGLNVIWLSVGSDVASRKTVGESVVDLMWSHAWKYLVDRQTGKVPAPVAAPTVHEERAICSQSPVK